MGSLERPFGGFGLSLLRVTFIKDSRRIRLAPVEKGTSGVRRIVEPPEDIEQLLIRDDFGVVTDFDRFAVPGRFASDLAVGRIRECSPHITRNSVQHARVLFKTRFGRPKTTGGEVSSGVSASLGGFNRVGL